MGIRLGMIGVGSFGAGFADLFMKHPAVDSIALCDIEPERIKAFSEKESWQKKIDINACNTSIDQFLKHEMDAVVVMTQPWIHAPQCLQVLESGKSVYSAVPLISLPDGDEILDLCVKLRDAVQKTGKHYMLGETTCFHPQAMFCRQKMEEGAEEISKLKDIYSVMDGKERIETLFEHDEMFIPLPEVVQEAWVGEEFTSSFGGHGGSHPYLVHEFIDSVANNRAPEIDIYDACRYMSAGVTANKSALHGGEVLDVPDFGDEPK